MSNRSAADGLAFADMTLASRAGVKGPGARAWLVERGHGPLPRPNLATRSPTGLLVAMLGENEALILDAPGTTSLWSYGSGAEIAPGVYPVARAEGTFWLTVSGPDAPDLFACLCAVDLRLSSFPDLQVAQTMVAKASAIIIRDDAAGASAYHLLGDISLGPYLFAQLLGAAPLR